jgi:hypothetical protein
MRDRIIGLGRHSSTGCAGQTRDRGYVVLGILGTVCPEGSLHLLWTLALSRLSQFVLETLGLGTIVPCYFVNNPCSVGIMEEGKSGEKLAIKFRIKTKLYCKLLS